MGWSEMKSKLMNFFFGLVRAQAATADKITVRK